MKIRTFRAVIVERNKEMRPRKGNSRKKIEPRRLNLEKFKEL